MTLIQAAAASSCAQGEGALRRAAFVGRVLLASHRPQGRARDRHPMTLIQAAAELGLTPDTLRQQIHAGVLRAQKVGRDWQVTRSEVERYRRNHRRAAGSAAMKATT